eukprot:14478639-Heterocapsa_arctica.AAC.1
MFVGQKKLDYRIFKFKRSEDRINQKLSTQIPLYSRFIARTTNEHSRQEGDSQCRPKYGQSHPEGHINALHFNVYITSEMNLR